MTSTITGLMVLFAGAIVGALIDSGLRRIRCSFCGFGYAFRRRANGRACRDCARSVDKKIQQAQGDRRPRLHSSMLKKGRG
jgi:hypothetical protein